MPIETITCPNFDAEKVSHGFFTRGGGVSTGIYAGLNCGPGSKDNPEAVQTNRRLAAQTISNGAADDVITLYQIHGAKAIAVHNTPDADTNTDPKTDPKARPKADALVTNRPGLVLGVLTADCGPILFSDPKAGVIGAAHAGWQGALSGIIESTLSAMEQLGAKRTQIQAAIGPLIRQKSYEVTADFPAKFISVSQSYASFFTAGQDADHLQFDLEAFIALRLREAEITSVWQAALDTYSDDRFFSFRRSVHHSEADYGRQISAIMIPVK